jgi:hypothetical protein
MQHKQIVTYTVRCSHRRTTVHHNDTKICTPVTILHTNKQKMNIKQSFDRQKIQFHNVSKSRNNCRV